MEERNMIEHIIKDFDEKEKINILKLYNKNNWNGCSRLISIINYSKLKLIQEKFNIFFYRLIRICS